MIKTFYPSVCKTCKCKFHPVDWMRCRVDGYCDPDCVRRFKVKGVDSMLTPVKGSLERLVLEMAVATVGKGFTYLDFPVDSGITAANLEQIVNNLQNNMFVAEQDAQLKIDA